MGTRASIKGQARTAAGLKTKAGIAPELMQGLQVLVMQVAELGTCAIEAAESNPLLEVNFDSELFSFEAVPSEDTGEGNLPTAVDDQLDFSASSSEHSRASSHASSVEWDFSRVQDQCMETETLQSFLHLQASELHLNAEDGAIMEALIEAVSDDGYFEGSTGQIAFDLHVEHDCVETLLRRLQTFQPVGVASRTVAECLKRQVSMTEQHYDVILEIIDNHLRDVAEGRLECIAKQCGVTKNVVISALAAIRLLNPRPGANFYQRPDFNYVVPDIVVKNDNGLLEAFVVGSQTPCLTINQEYAGMLFSEALDADAQRYLESCYAQASALIRTYELRNSTLQKFAAYLLRRQVRYFLTEGRILQPMTMKEVADDLQVHVSTVSRAVHGKYLQTPWGCVPLKSLFTRALPKREVDNKMRTVSSADVKNMIASLVARESHDEPLSDQKICEVLNQRGVDIQRRTVAKYRNALGIESQSARRRAQKVRMESLW